MVGVGVLGEVEPGVGAGVAVVRQERGAGAKVTLGAGLAGLGTTTRDHERGEFYTGSGNNLLLERRRRTRGWLRRLTPF